MTRLKLKSQQTNHPFDIEDLIGLDKKCLIKPKDYIAKRHQENINKNRRKK